MTGYRSNLCRTRRPVDDEDRGVFKFAHLKLNEPIVTAFNQLNQWVKGYKSCDRHHTSQMWQNRSLSCERDRSVP